MKKELLLSKFPCEGPKRNFVVPKLLSPNVIKVIFFSFSILFARLKGDLNELIKGAEAIEKLQDGSKILFLESCTHHAIDDDIARVKIPNLLKKKTQKKKNYFLQKNFVFHGNNFIEKKDSPQWSKKFKFRDRIKI